MSGLCGPRAVAKKWTHWDLNPGPSACEADVIPLHHEPSDMVWGVQRHCVCAARDAVRVASRA